MPEPEQPLSWEQADKLSEGSEGGPWMLLRQAIALARQEKERADKAIADLAECYRLTGADPDGNEDWRLAEHAVGEVRQLRKDCDDALNWEVFSAELAARLALADKLAEAASIIDGALRRLVVAQCEEVADEKYDAALRGAIASVDFLSANLRAYRASTIQAPPPDTIPESKEETS